MRKKLIVRNTVICVCLVLAARLFFRQGLMADISAALAGAYAMWSFYLLLKDGAIPTVRARNPLQGTENHDETEKETDEGKIP